jgi:signal transduction histidine kinase
MNPLRSVGVKLAVALLLVVTGALAIVYLIVVPSYQRSLVDTRLSGLQATLRTISAKQPDLFQTLPQQWVDEDAQPIATILNARVVVFSYTPSPRLVEPIADSASNSAVMQNDPMALRVAGRPGAEARGTVLHGGEEWAEAASSMSDGSVLLLSSPLHTELDTVNEVRQRVFVAGALAIAFAILLGYALASLFTRRIRRLEQAAERIADGRFEEAVVDSSQDELGVLARAFEGMRLQLASLERARSEFIGNASHELRTPLFSLAGYLELLADEELDPETRTEFIGVTREQVSRLTRLATVLLDLSRVDAGRLTVSSESLDLGQLGEELVGEFGPRAAATGHLLEGTPPAVVPALGDSERVLQIGRILVENALIHTPRGASVRVAAARQGGRSTLTVEDNGNGIPADTHMHVFDRFYRLDGTVASGSGLGLAIARELAELMDGRIELVSGNGSTRFTLVLHADDSGADDDIRPMAA